jgi:hypothetical protein
MATNEASISLLLTIPAEIILNILGFYNTLTLLSAESVCQSLGPLVLDSYESAYGQHPAHHTCNSFKTLAIEQLQFSHKRSTTYLPKDQCSDLLNNCYACNDQEFAEEAANALLKLQTISDTSTDAWNKAAATALIAQRRYREAERYYKRLTKSGNLLPERTNLTAARWGWPFAIPLPIVTS